MAWRKKPRDICVNVNYFLGFSLKIHRKERNFWGDRRKKVNC